MGAAMPFIHIAATSSSTLRIISVSNMLSNFVYLGVDELGLKPTIIYSNILMFAGAIALILEGLVASSILMAIFGFSLGNIILKLEVGEGV
jgi:hypothetical protein